MLSLYHQLCIIENRDQNILSSKRKDRVGHNNIKPHIYYYMTLQYSQNDSSLFVSLKYARVLSTSVVVWRYGFMRMYHYMT